MKKLTVGILSAGDMGHAVAKVLNEKGCSVLTVLKDRSDLTKIRANRANMEDVGDLDNLIERSDYVLSILPPDKATAMGFNFAEKFNQSGKNTVFVECNAISPQTTRLIANKVELSGATMIKVGIVGPPPGGSKVTKFYASGPGVKQLSFLESDFIKVVYSGDDLTRASAIKMCYAALTKGMMTLHTSVLMASELLGVSDELFSELAESQQSHWEVMKNRTSTYACDAGRWIGEMEEIAKTYSSVGMTPHIHNGAAAIFRVLDSSPLGRESRETIDTSRNWQNSIKIYADAVKELGE